MTLVLALAAYLCLWPVPIDAARWQAPQAPRLVVNDKLARSHAIDLKGETGPEHVALGPDGKLYVSVASGRILRLAQGGAEHEVVATTGGRPLGMGFDADGNLIVADAFRGLLSVAPDGSLSVLVKAGLDEAVTFPNALAVARDGKIYFTDSSRRFSPAQWGTTHEAALLDVFEQSATGRVLEYDPSTRGLRVIATGLSLPNGIVLGSDERSLLVSESGRYRVWKIDLARAPAGVLVLLDNLPGYPDNLTRGQDGRIWLGLAGRRNDLDAMAELPFLRELALRIPRPLWWTKPAPFGHVIAFTEDGKLVADLQDPSGNAATTTGATETADRLYIHNVDSGELRWTAK